MGMGMGVRSGSALLAIKICSLAVLKKYPPFSTVMLLHIVFFLKWMLRTQRSMAVQKWDYNIIFHASMCCTIAQLS